jgi:hypothetical protein
MYLMQTLLFLLMSAVNKYHMLLSCYALISVVILPNSVCYTEVPYFIVCCACHLPSIITYTNEDVFIHGMLFTG